MKKISFNLENKNIVITGGNGFLGSQITDALLNEKANVYIIDIKKPKKKNLQNILNLTSQMKRFKRNLKIFQIKKN